LSSSFSISKALDRVEAEGHTSQQELIEESYGSKAYTRQFGKKMPAMTYIL